MAYFDGLIEVTVLGNGGPGDSTDGVVRPLGFVQTVDPSVGAIDTIHGGPGRDLILGGLDGDNIDAGSDDSRDYVVGDQGELVFENGNLIEIRTSDASHGGNDMITTVPAPMWCWAASETM